MVISPWYHRLFSDLSHTKNHTKNAKNVVIARDLGDFTYNFCDMVKKIILDFFETQ